MEVFEKVKTRSYSSHDPERGRDAEREVPVKVMSKGNGLCSSILNGTVHLGQD